MPAHFISRLMLVRAPSGKLRLVYRKLTDKGADFEKLIVIGGPAPVEPPTQEFTEEEWKRWQFEFICGTGYFLQSQLTSIHAPMVEEVASV